MKWFSKWGGSGDGQSQASPSSSASRSRSSDDSEAAALLQQASEALEHLRTATAEDFPLLNQATRLVQQMEALVAGIRESDRKLAWRSQLEELQRELQLATSRMLSSHSPPPVVPAAGAPGTPVPARAGAAAARTQQQSQAAAAQGQPAILPSAPVAVGGALEDDLDLFSGLDLAGGEGAAGSAMPEGSVVPALVAPNAVPDAAALEAVPSGVGNMAPLDEELFSSHSEPEAFVALSALATDPPTATPAAQPANAQPRTAAPANGSSRPEVLQAAQLQSETLPSTILVPPAEAAALGGNLVSGLPARPTLGLGLQQSGATPAVRRKKVIRSRVGYARAEQPPPPQQQRPLAFAPPQPMQPVQGPSTHPTAATPSSVASESGSPTHSEAGEFSPSRAPDATSGRASSASAAGSELGMNGRGASKGSLAAVDSYGSMPSAAVRQRAGHSPASSLGGEGGSVGKDYATGEAGDDDDATGLAGRLRRGMNLALEVHPREVAVAGRPAHSSGSADSTIAVQGTGRGGYDSDDSITSPEFRPASSARTSLPSPTPDTSGAAVAAFPGGNLLAASASSPAAAAGGLWDGAIRSNGKPRPGASIASGTASAGSSPPRSPARQHATSLAEQVAALQASLQQKADELSGVTSQQAQQERAAKAQRLRLSAETAALAAQLSRLQQAEEEAVQREDFEQAACLGEELDAAAARLAELQQRIKETEQQAQQAAEQRVRLQQQQAELWEQAAGRLRSLQDGQRGHIVLAHQLADKAAQEASVSSAAAHERLAELRTNIAERQRVVVEQQASVDRKLAAATGALAQERESEEEACAALEVEVEALRAAVAAKEAELASRHQALAGVEAKIAGLTAKFEKSLNLINEDRRIVATYQRELEEEEAAAAAAQQRAEAALASARQQSQVLEQQLAEAEQAGRAIENEAARLRARADADQQILQLYAELQQAQLAAEGRVADAQAAAEALHDSQGQLAARRASLQHELGSAERKAASARLRVPELEAQKKAAAAVRDFKEAARLSAEAKAAASEAESAAQHIGSLRQQLASLEEEERELAGQVEQAEGAVERAHQEAARAKWRSIKAAEASLEKQLQQATEAEQYQEAEALQAQLDSLAAEGASLAAAHGLQESDAADVAADLLAAESSAAEAAQAATGLLAGKASFTLDSEDEALPQNEQSEAEAPVAELLKVGLSRQDSMGGSLPLKENGASTAAAGATPAAGAPDSIVVGGRLEQLSSNSPASSGGYLGGAASPDVMTSGSGSAQAGDAGAPLTEDEAGSIRWSAGDGGSPAEPQHEPLGESPGVIARGLPVDLAAGRGGAWDGEEEQPGLPQLSSVDELLEGLSLSSSSQASVQGYGDVEQPALPSQPQQQQQQGELLQRSSEEGDAGAVSTLASDREEGLGHLQASPPEQQSSGGVYAEGVLGHSSDEEEEATADGLPIPAPMTTVGNASPAVESAPLPSVAGEGPAEATADELADDLFAGLNLA
ncbi:hypothetical protein N2152v2_006476 [Parachlorella kessleri]